MSCKETTTMHTNPTYLSEANDRTVTLRLAGEDDYSRIFDIYMQPHVISYMSFSELTPDLYRRFLHESRVYVLEDSEKNIVAVRRMVFGAKGSPKEHTVSFCSMAIDGNCRRQGYATRFYHEFFDIAKREKKPEISRIELTQSYSNIGAFALSDKLGFETEATVPGWLQRTKNGGVYYLPERYITKFLDETIRDRVVNPDMRFTTMVPSGESLERSVPTIQREGDTFSMYNDQGQLMGTCEFQPGPRVVNHILFLSISLTPEYDEQQVIDCLRSIVLKAAQDPRGFKKIELSSHKAELLPILASLGFQYRGSSAASVKIENEYYNEVYADFGFLNIEDAKALIPAAQLSEQQETAIFKRLEECQRAIDKESLDPLMRLYLYNLVFQMAEQALCEYKAYPLSQAPWDHPESMNMGSLPETIQTALQDLSQELIPFTKNNV